MSGPAPDPASVCRTVAACAVVLACALVTAAVALAAWRWLPCAVLGPALVAWGAECQARLYEEDVR